MEIRQSWVSEGSTSVAVRNSVFPWPVPSILMPMSTFWMTLCLPWMPRWDFLSTSGSSQSSRIRSVLGCHAYCIWGQLLAIRTVKSHATCVHHSHSIQENSIPETTAQQSAPPPPPSPALGFWLNRRSRALVPQQRDIPSGILYGQHLFH